MELTATYQSSLDLHVYTLGHKSCLAIDPSAFIFFLKLHMWPKGLKSGGGSTNFHLWFCKMESISLLIASFLKGPLESLQLP